LAGAAAVLAAAFTALAPSVASADPGTCQAYSPHTIWCTASWAPGKSVTVTEQWAGSDLMTGSTTLAGQPVWLDRSRDGGKTWDTHLGQRTDGRTDSLARSVFQWRSCVTDTDGTDHCVDYAWPAS
jgi:hypothetical protein